MDPAEFRRASHAVWEAMAPGWTGRHALLEATARPVTDRMLERLAPSPGQTILDLAAGSGVAGFAAAAHVGPSGRVIVSDFSAAMAEAARRQAADLGLANVECRVIDAERIDLDDDAVDGVVCRWGYMLMADPAAALGETRRVLRPGGRLSFAVFSGPGENPFITIPQGVLSARGHMPPPDSPEPGVLALADRGRLRDLVTGAGFAAPEIDDVPFTWRYGSIESYWDFLSSAAGAIAMVLERLDADERERVRQEVAEQVEPYRTADGLDVPAVSLVVSSASGARETP